ncbi:MAG: 4-(cytidine 5'-diphospho)-2-C-methyl-D-erythritol kinase [Gemmatimonadaceae bacterium]|nr:4-(cytidine 5'-diphospho)-2-C-methyl-D-erythritol kinase [Gemmatimonadaceae bacterium]
MSGVRVMAQAKVNLSLRILARETSGYHQIETLFQRLALADVVTVREAATNSLDVRFGDAARATDLGPTEQNLAWRAAAAYTAVAGWPRAFAIEIEKWIPVGGGLGGGSADAAAVLRALDAMAPRPLGSDALIDLAARLGADVSFLASDAELAMAWGRGERVLRLPPLPPAGVLLVIPDFGINTGWAYGELAAHREASHQTPAAKQHVLPALAHWDGIAADAVNDFEVVVFERYPQLATVRAQLAALPRTILARMSGSGSTLFAVQETEATGAAPVGGLALPTGWRFVRTTTHTPLGVEPA